MGNNTSTPLTREQEKNDPCYKLMQDYLNCIDHFPQGLSGKEDECEIQQEAYKACRKQHSK